MVDSAPRLETERLILRAHTVEDFGDVAAMWASPVVVRYIGGRPSSHEESWARLLRYRGSWALLGLGFWALCDKMSGAYLGEAGLMFAQRALEPGFGKTPEAGWALVESAHGKGYGYEAVTTILRWADQQGIARTVCLIEPGNTPSIALAGRLGFSAYTRTTYHGVRVDLFERWREGVRPA